MALLSLGLMFASLAAMVVAWYRFHRRLKAKGYSAVFVSLVFVTLLIVSLGVFGSIFEEAADPSPAQQLLNGLEVSLLPLSWIALAALFAWFLPERRRKPREKPRVSGRRRSRVPYLWLGRLVNAVGVVALVMVVASSIRERTFEAQPYMAVLIVFGFGSYWLALGRRLKVAPTVIQNAEGAVLYLRAFGEERRPFVTGPSSILGRYTNSLTANTAVRRSRNDPTLELTMEDYLEEAITGQIGPFVGLGNPVDDLPPDGATREYAPDGAWQERFAELSRPATCIVLGLGQSDNLQWELAEIAREGMGRKLCVLTSPRARQKSGFGALTQALKSELANRDARATHWASGAEALARAGFECDPRCPGAGAVVGFDDQARSVLLTTDAVTPGDFVTPIEHWIKTATRTGNCVPAACASCGTAIYQLPDKVPDDEARLCFVCRTRAQLAGMSGFEKVLERHRVLGTLYALLCLVAAALVTIYLALDVKTWTGFLVFCVIFGLISASPWIASAGFRRLKRAWSAAARSSTTSIPPSPDPRAQVDDHHSNQS